MFMYFIQTNFGSEYIRKDSHFVRTYVAFYKVSGKEILQYINSYIYVVTWIDVGTQNGVEVDKKNKRNKENDFVVVCWRGYRLLWYTNDYNSYKFVSF